MINSLHHGQLRFHHVARKCIVGYDPGCPYRLGEAISQQFCQGLDQGDTHLWKVLRLDAVLDVLLAELGHDFRQQFNVRAEHIERRVDHLDQIRGVRDESTRL